MCAQVFKAIKLLLGKLEKASEDPESAMNQAAGMSHSYDVIDANIFHRKLMWFHRRKTDTTQIPPQRN